VIRSGTGRYIIGDEVANLGPGHLSIVGANLPHDWISDGVPGTIVEGRDLLIQFSPTWLGQLTALSPELHALDALLAAASRGIEFSGATARRAISEMEGIGRSSGVARLLHFLRVLELMSTAPVHERRSIASEWYLNPADPEAAATVHAGLEYIFANATHRVTLAEAARRANMSDSSFSKHFKRASGLTFTDMVRKLRLANARRLLIETDIPISEVCARVGYSNISNFNRQFLKAVGVTPREFRMRRDTQLPGQFPG
jgi:AraC-like DNA-binding protein